MTADPQPSHRIYDDLASLYPLLSKPEDYAAEAKRIRKVLREKLRTATLEPSPAGGGQGEGSSPPRWQDSRSLHPGPLPKGEGEETPYSGRPSSLRGRRSQKATLLELGVGSGHVLSHLVDRFDCVGVDLSPQMIEHAARFNPRVEHHVGDMRTVRLGRTFDAVLIHDAVHYMLTEDDLLAAMRTAAAHLRPGGVLLVLPRYVRETFRDLDVTHDLDVSRSPHVGYVMQARDPDPGDTTYELTILLLVRDEGGRLRVEEDRHTCGLFPVATWLRLLDEAGFDADPPALPRGRAAADREVQFVGVKR